ncbi:hypothetical protein GCM10007973_05090 [Polymorphobacter multimanifer]|uniref:Uncharacterized protein n=1 Tax=Polymorphobacter multimanifer TaxID=1070431 RepID=A0A841L480_9SPHN|nr:hypothetical protein [Polymorphobacter multimanifer]MBB6227659.1 hypothetical protein [Polymorphobacter multimanifer]GGI71085.1 hypothetical protein GCM10007973_05090 [Polymorphobacter multimanifer]
MDIEIIRQRAQKAISPLKQAELSHSTYMPIFMSGKRTSGGRRLPDYYLLYFLLVDLLGFRNNGQWEKTSWSVTVEFEGTPFLIAHRKFGLGLFGLDGPNFESTAARVASCLHRAVKAARPYFDWRAQVAAEQAHLNVLNRSSDLLQHLQFHLVLYDARAAEADTRNDEVIKTQISAHAWTVHRPSVDLRREARHYAIAAIEGFFSWTEHVFIHIAILLGAVTTGKEVNELAKAEWAEKCKAALDLTDAADKRFYDELAELSRQLRNFVAHGSFGKDGEALQFHSGAGAVPMLLPHRRSKSTFRFGSGFEFRLEPSIALVNAFMNHLWTGSRSPAKIYI